MGTFEDLLASYPQSVQPEFVMAVPDESIRLAVGRFDILRDSQLLGHLEGEITLEWVPKLQLTCRGVYDFTNAEDLFDGRPLDLHVSHLGLTSQILVTNWEMRSRAIQALLLGADNQELKSTQKFRFYLVNFPFFLGEPVRTGSGPFAGLYCDRLKMTAGSLVCTIDRIRGVGSSEVSKSGPGYLLTHVAEVKSDERLIAPAEIRGFSMRWIGFLRS